MTNDIIAKVMAVPERAKLLAAIEEIQLQQQEYECSRRAVIEAEKALDAAIAESLKHIPLKWMEGELVKVVDYNRLYCYLDDKFTCIHIDRPPEVLNEGIL